VAQRAIDAALGESSGPTEPGVARDVMAALPEGSSLVLSSSMPVRDVEWFAAPRAGVEVYSNRGANGIDGVVSTAVGVALATRRPTALLIGDVAVLHDTNGMLLASSRDIDLTIVVVDNDGGGIFSFLPQATSLPPDTFERLFGTPHGVDLISLAAVHGIPEVTSLGEGSGVRMVRVPTDRRLIAEHDRQPPRSRPWARTVLVGADTGRCVATMADADDDGVMCVGARSSGLYTPQQVASAPPSPTSIDACRRRPYCGRGGRDVVAEAGADGRLTRALETADDGGSTPHRTSAHPSHSVRPDWTRRGSAGPSSAGRDAARADASGVSTSWRRSRACPAVVRFVR
jgi:hypothetical protein